MNEIENSKHTKMHKENNGIQDIQLTTKIGSEAFLPSNIGQEYLIPNYTLNRNLSY